MQTGGDARGCIHSPCNFSLNTAVRYFQIHKRNDSVWLFSTKTLTQKGKHTRLLSPEIKIMWLQYESSLWAMWHDCGTIHFHVLCTIERLLQMVHLHSSRNKRLICLKVGWLFLLFSCTINSPLCVCAQVCFSLNTERCQQCCTHCQNCRQVCENYRASVDLSAATVFDSHILSLHENVQKSI